MSNGKLDLWSDKGFPEVQNRGSMGDGQDGVEWSMAEIRVDI